MREMSTWCGTNRGCNSNLWDFTIFFVQQNKDKKKFRRTLAAKITVTQNMSASLFGNIKMGCSASAFAWWLCVLEQPSPYWPTVLWIASAGQVLDGHAKILYLDHHHVVATPVDLGDPNVWQHIGDVLGAGTQSVIHQRRSSIQTPSSCPIFRHHPDSLSVQAWAADQFLILADNFEILQVDPWGNPDLPDSNLIRPYQPNSPWLPACIWHCSRWCCCCSRGSALILTQLGWLIRSGFQILEEELSRRIRWQRLAVFGGWHWAVVEPLLR